MALYCASVWLSSTCQSNQMRLEAEQNKAARIISGCPASSPSAAALQEANLAPLHLTADSNAAILAERICRRPFEHAAKRVLERSVPLRLKAHGRQGATITSWRDEAKRVSAWAGLATSNREPVSWIDREPPWEDSPQVSIHTVIPGISRDDPDHSKRQRALEWLDSLPPASTTVWTDGAAVEANKDGGSGALIVYEDGTRVELHGPAGAISSSFRAEMTALLLATSSLLEADHDLGEEVRLCTDSRSALQSLAHLHTDLKMLDATSSAVWRNLRAISGEHHVNQLWIPAHCGLAGNEHADRLTTVGSMVSQERAAIDLSSAKASLKHYPAARAREAYLSDPSAAHHRACSSSGSYWAAAGFSRRVEVGCRKSKHSKSISFIFV